MLPEDDRVIETCRRVFNVLMYILDFLNDIGWIILGWISRRWDVGIWTGLGWPRIETGGGRV